MTTGRVTATREAVIHIVVHGPSGQKQRIRAVIDTGYDGHLTLPPTVIASLGLPWRRRGLARLADGSQSVFDICEGTVTWNRRRQRIPVDEIDVDPLVGMSLLEGHELRIQVRAQGKVTINRLP